MSLLSVCKKPSFVFKLFDRFSPGQNLSVGYFSPHPGRNQDFMLNNVALQELTLGDLTLEGYSRAAVQSYWRIPEFKIGFDLGAQPWDFMGTATWFVSHTHLDHIAALPVYIARRRMMKMSPPRIFLPEHAIDPTRDMLRAFSRLDRGRLPCELVPVTAGQEIELSRELVVTVHATTHTVPSVGYLVWERRQKLKQEYQGLGGEEIRAHKEAGRQISEEKRLPLVGYLGDTSPSGLDQNPEFYEARYLISEMTFVAAGHRKEKIHKHGHMHLDDYIERAHLFKNKKVIVGHFSTRYSRQQIINIVKKSLPGMLDGRLHLWL